MADGVRLRWRRGVRRLMFLTVRGLLRVVGFARARRLGQLVGELLFRLGGRSRRRMEAEMAHALRRPADDAAVPSMLREAYRVNTAAVFEVMAMLDRRQDEAMLARPLARSTASSTCAKPWRTAAARSCWPRTWATPRCCRSDSRPRAGR